MEGGKYTLTKWGLKFGKEKYAKRVDPNVELSLLQSNYNVIYSSYNHNKITYANLR